MKRFIVLLALIMVVWTYINASISYKETVYMSKQIQQSNVQYERVEIKITGEIIEYNREMNTVVLSVATIDELPANEKWLLKGDELPVVEQSIQNNNFHILCFVDKNQYQYTSNKNLTGFDYDKYLYALGITRQYKIVSYEWIESEGFSLNTYRHGIRNGIEDALDQLPSDESRSFLKALLLGDKGAFEAYETFKSLGLAHLFAISGLHFGVLYVSLKKGIFLKIAPLKSALIVCLMGFLLFVVGASASAQRAFILIVYKEGCDLFERKTDPFVGLAFTLIIILIIQPFLVLSTSLHLSFYAYFCVAIAYRSLFSKPLSNKPLEAIRFACVVQVLLLPATLYYFQTANLFTFIANALIVPLLAIILPIAFVFLGTNLLNISIFLTISMTVLDRLVRLTLYLSGWMPLKLSTYGPFLAVDYHVVLYLMAVYISFKIFWHLRMIKKKYFILQSCILILILLLGSIPKTTISFIDVGHGDLAILSSGNIHGIIDTGDGRLNVAEMLRSKGIYQLEFVILSHAHQDHIGDIETLSNEMAIKTLYMNQSTADKILEQAPHLSSQINVVEMHCEINIGTDIKITLMPIIGTQYKQDPNEDALIAKVNIFSQTGYFLGDISKAMIDKLVFEDNISFIKSAHHGSATSLSTTLYGEHAIERVITSCHTRYKMPHKEFNALLNQNQIPHYTTYNYGEVKLTFDKNKVKLKTYLAP